MDDLEEIKKAVSTKPLPEPIAAEPLPHEIIDLEKMVQETPKIAPLFVKLEKYKEILENVKNLRETVNRIKILLALKKQIETIDADADDMIFKYMQSLSDTANQFSIDFALPRGMSYLPRPEVREEESVADLKDKIARLREELSQIKI